jgi:MSHA biogenesis protein MshQ
VGLYDGTSAADLSGNIAPSPSSGAWTNGIFAPTATTDTYTRGAAPGAPVNAGYVAIRATDVDGAVIGRATAAQVTVGDTDFKTGTPVCTSGCTHKKVAGVPTSFRYGRLWVGNAYGSERLNLSLPYETQFWNGFAFVRNTLDTCTALNAANFGIGNYQGTLSAASLPVASITVGPFATGAGSIIFTAPNVAGSADLVVRLNPTLGMCPAWAPAYPAGAPTSADYLRGKWCGASYDKDPLARATFGLSKSGRQIYLREGY